LKQFLIAVGSSAVRCIICKGKGLCGKPCPFTMRMKSTRLASLPRDMSFMGSSPPSVFVGRADYPRVRAGILAPPTESEAAWQLDSPKFWFDEQKPVMDIVDMRQALLNSRFEVNVKKPNKVFDVFKELAMTDKVVDVEFKVEGLPTGGINFDQFATPMGPAVDLLSAKLAENAPVPAKIESRINDEMKAADAMTDLYGRGIDVYHLSRLLSAGLLGLEKKLVPTRWSITAVDDIVSKALLSSVRQNPSINEFEVYHCKYLDNDFHVILLPGCWSFEQVEAYVSGTAWYCAKWAEPAIMKDREGYYGRKTYASKVSGAYYAARLEAASHLKERGRQASCLIVRTIGPAYSVPLGVWQIRENVRGALAGAVQKFPTLDAALNHIQESGCRVPKEVIMKESRILRDARQQKSLLEF